MSTFKRLLFNVEIDTVHVGEWFEIISNFLHFVEREITTSVS